MKKINMLFYLACLVLFSCQNFSDEQYNLVKNEDGITIEMKKDAYRFTVFRDDIIRVDYFHDKINRQPDASYSVILNKEKTGFSIKESAESVSLITAEIMLTVKKEPFVIEWKDKNGKKLLSGKEINVNGGQKTAIFNIQPEDHYYGMGQKTIEVDRKGYADTIYNKHVGGYTKPYGNMQVNIPYIYSPVGYGVFVDNPWLGSYDLGKTNPEEWYYRVSGGIFSYFFVQGENLEDLQKYYYDLTGYPPIPPKWAFGLLQSKCAYESDTMVYRIVNEFNKRNMPIDAIILDAYWFGGYKQEYPKTMGNFTWLKMNFPDHRQYLDSLHGMGIKTILINEPYINTDSENWDLLEKEGWLVPQEGKDEPYIWSPSWCGDNALFDATNPEAREWLWGKFRDFISEGVDGLWIDLTEPERAVPNGLYHLGPNDKIHNIYNNIWSEMLWEGYEKDFPGQRIFNLTRGGYAGVQRYGAINWSGDASKTWVSFKMQVPMLIGCTMSGMPHYSSDIGGFTNAWDRIDGLTLFTNFDGEKILTTPELYTRWFQFGVFSPLLRPHSGEEQYCEPFSHGPEAEKITTRYLKWRYRLVPFLYSYAYKTASTGELLIKPVFKKDGNIANYEYRYGNEFFVAPVLEESQANRSFYLPELENDAKWVDFWTGESFESGKELTLVVDIENIPVFVRQGAIIPLAKDKKYTMESPDDTLTLRIYPGAGGEFELYEDDGLSTAWKKGEFATTNITSKQEDDKFSIQIAPIVGSYDGMIENRVWKFDVQTIKDFKSVSVNGQNVEGRKSNNNLEIIVVSETKKQVAVVIEGIVLK